MNAMTDDNPIVIGCDCDELTLLLSMAMASLSHSDPYGGPGLTRGGEPPRLRAQEEERDL